MLGLSLRDLMFKKKTKKGLLSFVISEISKPSIQIAETELLGARVLPLHY